MAWSSAAAPGPAVAEDLDAPSGVGGDEVGHVLDDAEHGHGELLEHGDGLGGVLERDGLGRRDDDRAGDGDVLGGGHGGVAGAGRQVDDQVVELAPGDVAQELLDAAAESSARARRRASRPGAGSQWR